MDVDSRSGWVVSVMCGMEERVDRRHWARVTSSSRILPSRDWRILDSLVVDGRLLRVGVNACWV